MKSLIITVSGIFLFSFFGCSSLTLAPANFSWAIESVLPVNQQGMVTDKRYAVSFNAKPLFFAEKGDSALFFDEQLHIIKNEKGYYFITAKSFSGVYVFQEAEGALTMTNKILLKYNLVSPAFNARPPWIELVDGSEKYLLDNKGFKGN